MKKLLFILAATATLFCACSKEASFEPQTDSSRLVRFSTYMGEYSFKAIDVIEAGENIGVFAGAPINVDNQSLAVATGNTITSSDAIQWTASQISQGNPATSFYAYYPYGAGNATTTLSFATQTDQSSEANYKASDLMIASAPNVTPGTDVSLAFSHALSKATIVVTCTNMSVKSVTIEGVKTNATVDLTGAAALATSGDAANITPYKVSEAAGVYTFAAIIAPQTASPVIRVVTNLGFTYTFNIVDAFTFEAGKNATATLPTITYTPGASSPNSVSFATFTSAAWTDATAGNTAGSSTLSQANKWSMIGSIYGSSWNQDFYLEQNANDENEWFIKDVALLATDTFKFRYNNSWDNTSHQFGGSGSSDYTIAVQDDTQRLIYDTPSSQNLKVAENGTYDIYLTVGGDKQGKIWIEKQ